MNFRNFFILFVLLFCLFQLTHAASIGVSPLIFEEKGEPGKKIELFLKVYNGSKDKTLQVVMEKGDIEPTGDSGFVIVQTPGTQPASLASWAKIEPETFTLAPKEEKTVKIIIDIPQNVSPGSYLGTVLASTQNFEEIPSTGAKIVQRIGSLILLEIPGIAKVNFKIQNFATKKFWEKGPINFEILFENSGNVVIKPRGEIKIKNILGQTVETISLPEYNILPGAKRKIEMSWSKKWLFQFYYRAILEGQARNLNFSSEISFFVIPWKFYLVFLFLIIFLILIRKRLILALKVLIKGEK